MEATSEKSCTSVFIHSPSELTEAFTELWVQFINEKEEDKNAVFQANIQRLS